MFSDSIIWYLFLGGGGAGAVTVLALCDLLFGRWSKRPGRERLAWTQELSTPFFVRGYLFAGGALVLGTLCLLLDLAHPERFLYVLLYPTASVLTFGSYVLSATVACTVALGAIALFGSARTPLALIKALEVAAVACGTATMVYTGVLLAQIDQAPARRPPAPRRPRRAPPRARPRRSGRCSRSSWPPARRRAARPRGTPTPCPSPPRRCPSARPA